MLYRIDVEGKHVAPAQDGAPEYEFIYGRFHGALEPASHYNAVITDLEAAPRNGDGLVEYSATFAIGRPLDPERSSGLALYDVPNRGMGWMGFGPGGDVTLNAMKADPDGHIKIISGWQGDIPHRMGLQTAEVPIAVGTDGTSLTGQVLVRLADMPRGALTLDMVGGLALPVPRPKPVSLDTQQAALFRLAAEDAPLETIPPEEWSFGDCTQTPFPGSPEPTKISLRTGFDPDFTYILAYEAKDPKVLGIGFAATRDLITFLRFSDADSVGTANPLAGSIRWVIGNGVSQAGNFLKSFLNLGFNEGEDGRPVFDGMNVHIAARQVPLNIRFGLPGGAANLYEIGSEGPAWWAPYHDQARGRGITSLLDRCVKSGSCPKIVETFGSSEIWGLKASLALVGTDAKADIPLPANVRRYYFPGVTHFGSFTGGFRTKGDPNFPGMPKCVMLGNPNPLGETMRMAHEALRAWVMANVEPPASCYPTLTAGDLVEPTAACMGWPAIPDAPLPDGKLNQAMIYDFGPRFRDDDLSGIVDNQPPALGPTIPALVPRVDADGNEMIGIPSVQHLVPLGTYTGWNERAEGYNSKSSAGFFGGFIPFARTQAERLAKHDPRPSLEERYGDHPGFVEKVRKAASERVASGWLHPEDAERLIRQAEESDVLVAI